jgi:hypothetical protein
MCMSAVHRGPWSSMHQLFKTGRAWFPEEYYLPSQPLKQSEKPQPSVESAYDAWLESRVLPRGELLVPGAHRSFSLCNVKLASVIVRRSAVGFVWPSIHAEADADTFLSSRIF